MAKIVYTDKVDIVSQPVPEVNKVTAANMNEIKESVNNNFDDIASNLTLINNKSSLNGDSSEVFEVADGVGNSDAINKGQFDSVVADLITTKEHYADLSALIADQSNQTSGDEYFVLDATGFSLVDYGYTYVEYLGTTNEDEDDYRIKSAEQAIAAPRQFKLFVKTTSVSATFEIPTLSVTSETDYKIIDNVSGDTVKESSFTSVLPISADLSSTSGDCSIWVDVNETGNGAKILNCENLLIYSFDKEVFPNLQEIYINDNDLVTLDVNGLQSLNRLDCFDNDLVTLDVLGSTGLSILLANNNDLSTIDLTNLSDLIRADLQNNTITSATTTGCTSLSILRLKSNSLTSFDASINSMLTRLEIQSNSLTSLTLTGLTDLDKLFCNNNSLTSLDLTNLTALERVECDNNSLTTLTITGATAIEHLEFHNNSITSLDASLLTSLTTFYAYDNDLSSLDVKNGNNTNFGNFNITGNASLTCVLVDDVTYANANFTSKDAQTAYSDTTCPI